MSNTSPLGANQVLKKTYNEALDALDVNTVASALPAGAATSAKQDEQTVLLTDIENNADGLEASLTSIDSKASTLITQTDGIETFLASIDTKVSTAFKQDAQTSLLTTIGSNTDGIETQLGMLITQTDGVEGSLSSIDTKVSTAANQVSELAKLDTLISQTDGLEGSLSSIDSKASTLITQTDGLEASLSSLDSKAFSVGATTSSVTRVSASASSVQLLASTPTRTAAYFFNDSTSLCYLKLGTTASTISYTKRMESGEFLILNLDPIYTGRVDAIWVSANGAMQITELTP